MQLDLTIQSFTKCASVPDAAQFEQWVSAALSNRKAHAEVCIRLIDKPESASLNEQYRNKIGPTNVLSFNSSLPPELASDFLLGDLAICAPLVAEEALAAGFSIEEHWAHLTVHGCLHLLGYDHEIEADAIVMEKLETEIMLSLGLPNPYS
jgi:probable rRNA maturation factor